MSAATVKINSKRFMVLPPLPGNPRIGCFYGDNDC
jgi:hypothetical protein